MRSNLSLMICFSGCALLVCYKLVLLDSGLNPTFIQWNKNVGILLTLIGVGWLFIQFSFDAYHRFINKRELKEE